jgi:hypothetical protein
MSAAEPLDEGPQEESIDLPPITNPADAEWRLRRYNRLMAQRAEHEATFKALVEQTQAWFEEETAAIDRELQTLEFILRGWLLARIAEDPKGPKSTKLPSGTLSSSKGSLSVEVVDQEAFLAWAKEHRPEWVETPQPPPPPPPRPAKAEIKKSLTADLPEDAFEDPGAYDVEVTVDEDPEPIPGIALVRGERTFKVQGGRF